MHNFLNGLMKFMNQNLGDFLKLAIQLMLLALPGTGCFMPSRSFLLWNLLPVEDKRIRGGNGI